MLHPFDFDIVALIDVPELFDDLFTSPVPVSYVIGGVAGLVVIIIIVVVVTVIIMRKKGSCRLALT
jgi:hypothetical protein